MAEQKYLTIDAGHHESGVHPVTIINENTELASANDKILVKSEGNTYEWKSLPDLSTNVKLQYVTNLADPELVKDTNTIYLVKKETSTDDNNNIYNEYIYCIDIEEPVKGHFELIGSLNSEVDLGGYAKADHTHGNITNNGMISKESISIEKSSKLVVTSNNGTEKNKITVADIPDILKLKFNNNSNQYLGGDSNFHDVPQPQSLNFVETDSLEANQYLSKDGSWKDINDIIKGKEILPNNNSNNSCIGWLGNQNIEIDGDVEEIYGYVLTGGTSDITSKNTDIVQFNITKQSINDMYVNRIKTYGNGFNNTAGSSDFQFNFNLSTHLSPQNHSKDSMCHIKILINIENLYDEGNPEKLKWMKQNKLILRMDECQSHLYNHSMPAIDEMYDYISGIHYGRYDSNGIIYGYHLSAIGNVMTVKGGTDGKTGKNQISSIDGSGYGGIKYPTWSTTDKEWKSTGMANAVYEGINFFNEAFLPLDGNKQPIRETQGVTNIKLGGKNIDDSQKAPARIFVYYR